MCLMIILLRGMCLETRFLEHGARLLAKRVVV
jgi:hypothetical protein